MNELADDVSSNDAVIARLRSALDEVTAETHGLVAVETPRPRVSAGRLMAAAAAVVLIVGAVSAIAINRGSAPDVASTPTEVATTMSGSLTPTEPTLIRVVTPRYTLIAEDLVPGPDTSVPNLLANETSMVWALDGNPINGLFVLRSGPGSPNMAPADTSLAAYEMIGDQAVTASSYAIDAQQQAALLAQVQPGSGLPWVLPVDGWTYLGVGTGNDGPTFEQSYSSEVGTVVLNVGPLANQFLTLATIGGIEQAKVAGRDGWKASSADGAYVLWPAGESGQWASLKIPASLVDRLDGLITAVVELTAHEPTAETVLAPSVDTAVPASTPTASDPESSAASAVLISGDPLPPFDGTASTDIAVGMPAPAVNGFDYAGNEILVNPADGPHLVMFDAHWCPHCAANLPNVIDWMADGTIPSWLPVTLVSTAESSTSANYPADMWLQENGWTGRVLHDPNDDDGTAGAAARAYGATGWPYFVVIGVDGNVLARASGELTKQEMQQLLTGLPAGPETLGRLEIPAIGVDWFVVDNSLTLAGSARFGPVFLGDTLPTELPIGGSGDGYTMIYGNRTAYGAPFLKLDQLVVGDTFTWTDGTGTATFEVTSTDACAGADTCSTIAGSLMLTTSDPLFTDQGALFVFARRVS